MDAQPESLSDIPKATNTAHAYIVEMGGDELKEVNQFISPYIKVMYMNFPLVQYEKNLVRIKDVPKKR